MHVWLRAGVKLVDLKDGWSRGLVDGYIVCHIS